MMVMSRIRTDVTVILFQTVLVNLILQLPNFRELLFRPALFKLVFTRLTNSRCCISKQQNRRSQGTAAICFI